MLCIFFEREKFGSFYEKEEEAEMGGGNDMRVMIIENVLKAREFEKVKVYAGSSVLEPLDGKIRNLVIVNRRNKQFYCNCDIILFSFFNCLPENMVKFL